MHGHLEGMTRLSAFARHLRAEVQEAGRHVLFWDAGDAADRRVQICSSTKGSAFSPILNAMGYQLQTMGNDIALPYGPQAMARVAARAHFPILAANCRDGDGPLPTGLEEYTAVPLPQGLTMGVIGLTAPWDGMYEVFGLRFPDFREVASRLVTQLRSQGMSPIVVLSHLGLEDDRLLAQSVENLDLIIGAHSHDRLPAGETVNGVLIAQAGQYAEAIGRVDLSVDAGKGRVVTAAAQVIDVPRAERPDLAVERAILEAEEEVGAILAQPIGSLASSLDLDHFRECGIGDLAADALREHFGAEIAMVSSGLFHHGLDAGTLTFGALDGACFTTANPCVTELTGEQVAAALERGLDPAISRFKHQGFRGTPVGIPQISGMEVVCDTELGQGPRVRRITIQGKGLEPRRSYRLAHTDAETMPEIAYLRVEVGQVTRSEAPTILREVIEDYVRRHSPVQAPLQGRWLSSNRL